MAKRRGNGEGSVYRRGDGRVVGEYVDANGRRRYVSGRTKGEVKAKLRKLLADRDEGIAYDSENLTVGSYLYRWLSPELPTCNRLAEPGSILASRIVLVRREYVSRNRNPWFSLGYLLGVALIVPLIILLVVLILRMA